MRRLDQPEARKLEGTEGAFRLFWSPDSQSIGFFTDGFMRWVPAEGGPAVNLVESPDGRGGAWGNNGTILFAPNYIGGFFRVSADGGSATPVTQTGGQHSLVTHRYPHLPPDGEPDFYVEPRVALDNRRIAFRTSDPAAGSTLWIQNLETGFRTRFTLPPTDAYAPVWSPDGGQIAFGMRTESKQGMYVKATIGGTPEELLLEGDFTPLSWSPDGQVLLAHSTSGTGMGGDLWTVPVDKTGEPTKIAQNLEQLRGGRFSPDGRLLISVPLDRDIDHSITLETGWATQLSD